jgi:hypothetical protein
MTGPARRNFRSWLVWRKLRWALAAATVPFALWACNSHPLEQPKPAPEQQTDLLYEVNPLRQLDLVFLVDNSSSMREEQNNLRTNFPAFMAELEKIPGGLPDTRIAVVSSNFGAGQTTPAPECMPYGDRGKFQVKPGCGLDPAMGGYWLTTGSGVQNNFNGSLANVFSCMAELGTGGCGYEHQLQSLRAALAGSTVDGCMGCPPENRGFLRKDAYLGVVVLSDEDDCSGEPNADFFKDQVPGQAGSLRCALLGHVCNNMPVPPMLGFTAPLASCEPYVRQNTETNSRLINVQEFVDYIRALKNGRVDKVLVSSIIGWNDAPNAEYKITERPASSGTGTELDLEPACRDTATGSAAPGIRLRKFTQSFPNNTVHGICQANLATALTDIGKKLAGILTNTCITQPLVDTDGDTNNNGTVDGIRADCQVVDRVPRDDSPTGYRDTPLPRCSGNNTPCWNLAADATCGSGYKTVVDRGGTEPPPNTLQSIRCLTCADNSADPRCVQKP